jgi:signal transduction histidine kinase
MIRSLDIARDDRAPTIARRALDDIVSPAMDEAVLDDARLLVTELVTNSVRHGQGDVVRLVVDEPEPGRLRVEVIDDGNGFLPIARRAGADEAGGWGLHLVEELSESWGVREGSTHVWFELAPR